VSLISARNVSGKASNASSDQVLHAHLSDEEIKKGRVSERKPR